VTLAPERGVLAGPVFLSGPMGAGKSTVGAALARALGVPFVDLDAEIERAAASTIARVFEERGEAAFRAMERQAALALDPSPKVVALGGGTIVDAVVRRALLDRGIVITLSAPVSVLARRIAGTRDRPLLASRDPEEVLTSLIAARAAAYAECHAALDASGPLEVTVARAEAVVRDPPIVVALGERTYRVEVGAGVASRAAERSGASRLAILVTDTNVAERWAAPVRAQLEAAGARTATVVLPAGESRKTIGSVEEIWDVAIDAGADRGTVLVAVGGGVVGDLAGFAAATLLRGVPWVAVPTTLLAMVDASVGGKTGFDRPQGKNLVGAFHQPRAVLCDVDCLATLDPAERTSGLAEVAKAAWLEGEGAVAALERGAAALAGGEPIATTAAIRRAVALKAEIVAGDEREESGRRALLNLGHTFGHAIEARSGWQVRHGEAVARGMVAAMRISVALGHAKEEHAARLEALLAALGLPRDVGPYLDGDALAYLGADKKRSGADVRFVLPAAPGATEIRAIPLGELRALAPRITSPG
jgi:shikimate kinase/3-dehydroquinate synthase